MTRLRVSGLEPDNLLAFLALLGLLRALQAERVARDAAAAPVRAVWSLDEPPVRPVLVLPGDRTRSEVAAAAAAGLDHLAADHDFDGRLDLDYPPGEARVILAEAAQGASSASRGRADLIAALMSDAAVRSRDDPESAKVEPTPLCLMFGQGRQHFLGRLADIVRMPAPPGPGKPAGSTRSADRCLEDALFEPWRRRDPTPSFRWDIAEDVRYALRAGDPTSPAYKAHTQHGANRLAAAGIAALTAVPQGQARDVRLGIRGGAWDRDGFSLAWPIWRDPATLWAILGLLDHPGLRTPGGLAHLGVEHVLVARRISVLQFLNFGRARVISPETAAGAGA